MAAVRRRSSRPSATLGLQATSPQSDESNGYLNGYLNDNSSGNGNGNSNGNSNSNGNGNGNSQNTDDTDGRKQHR